MDRKEFFEKAEKALNQAFEATKKSVTVVAEKAGEAANVTKLLVEKVNLEHKVNKQLARLGASVYEKSAREGKAPLLPDPEIEQLVRETKDLEAELAQVEATLEREAQEIKKFPKRSSRG